MQDRVNILVSDGDSCALVGLSLKGGEKPDLVSRFVAEEAKKGVLIQEQSYNASYICTHRSVRDTRGVSKNHGEVFTSIVQKAIDPIENIMAYNLKVPNKEYPDYSDFDLDQEFLSKFEIEYQKKTGLPLLAISTPEDAKGYAEDECGGVYTAFLKPIEERILSTKKKLVPKQAKGFAKTLYDFQALPESITTLPAEKDPQGNKNPQYKQIILHAAKKYPGKALHFVVLDDMKHILQKGLTIDLDDPSFPSQVPITVKFYQHDAFEIYSTSIEDSKSGKLSENLFKKEKVFSYIGTKQNKLAQLLIPSTSSDEGASDKKLDVLKEESSVVLEVKQSKQEILTKVPLEKSLPLSDSYGLDEDEESKQLINPCVERLADVVMKETGGSIINTDEFREQISSSLVKLRDEFKQRFDSLPFDTMKSLLLAHVVVQDKNQVSSVFKTRSFNLESVAFEEEVRKHFVASASLTMRAQQGVS